MECDMPWGCAGIGPRDGAGSKGTGQFVLLPCKLFLGTRARNKECWSRCELKRQEKSLNGQALHSILLGCHSLEPNHVRCGQTMALCGIVRGRAQTKAKWNNKPHECQWRVLSTQSGASRRESSFEMLCSNAWNSVTGLRHSGRVDETAEPHSSSSTPPQRYLPFREVGINRSRVLKGDLKKKLDAKIAFPSRASLRRTLCPMAWVVRWCLAQGNVGGLIEEEMESRRWKKKTR